MLSDRAINFSSADLLKKIGNRKTSRVYRNREIIFKEGDTADAMFYIQDGHVKLSVRSRRGKQAVIAILRKGDFFGERCLVRRSLRRSTATSIRPSIIARVKSGTVGHIIQKEPESAQLVISYLLSRIIRIEEDLVDQIFNPSEKRLARILLLLAPLGKQRNSAVLNVSQQTLAEMVGTTRSRVSFFMNRFRKMGLIHYNGGLQVRRKLLTFALEE